MLWIPDSVGWTATTIFAVSYFYKGARLRLVQAVAAATCATYGVIIHSLPVIVANILVVTLALVTAWRQRRLPSTE